MIRRKTIITVIIPTALLIALVILALSKNGTPIRDKSQSTTSQTAAEESSKYTLVIAKNKLTSGPETITFSKGQRVLLSIVPEDQDESEFLVQGLGQGGNIQTGSVSEYEFVANKSGSYPLLIVPEQEDDEPHHPNVQIGTLIVE